MGDYGFKKTVAIKKILPQLATNSSFVSMFVDEARISATRPFDASFSFPDEITEGETFRLKAMGSDPDGPDALLRYSIASDQPGRLKRPAKSITQAQGTTKATITIDGSAQTVTMEKDQTVLEAALAHNLDAPFACRAGVCSTCKCRLTKGQVEMAANHALEDYEVEAGFILSCQSFPLTDEVAVDYDQH